MRWILILAFIGLIGFLVYKECQRKKADASAACSPPPAPVSPPKPSVGPSSVKKTEVAEFVSIYEYAKLKAAKRCIYCDGENDRSAQVCCICGGRIKN